MLLQSDILGNNEADCLDDIGRISSLVFPKALYHMPNKIYEHGDFCAPPLKRPRSSDFIDASMFATALSFASPVYTHLCGSLVMSPTRDYQRLGGCTLHPPFQTCILQLVQLPGQTPQRPALL